MESVSTDGARASIARRSVRALLTTARIDGSASRTELPIDNNRRSPPRLAGSSDSSRPRLGITDAI